MARGDLTAAQWRRLKPLLPRRVGRGGNWKPHRKMINGIRWRMRTGAPWRDVPRRYGPWQSVYDRFNRWSKDGTWDRILRALQGTEAKADELGVEVWLVDGSVVRAHVSAAGGGKKGGLTNPLTTRWAKAKADSVRRST